MNKAQTRRENLKNEFWLALHGITFQPRFAARNARKHIVNRKVKIINPTN